MVAQNTAAQPAAENTSRRYHTDTSFPLACAVRLRACCVPSPIASVLLPSRPREGAPTIYSAYPLALRVPWSVGHPLPVSALRAVPLRSNLAPHPRGRLEALCAKI